MIIVVIIIDTRDNIPEMIVNLKGEIIKGNDIRG